MSNRKRKCTDNFTYIITPSCQKLVNIFRIKFACIRSLQTVKITIAKETKHYQQIQCSIMHGSMKAKKAEIKNILVNLVGYIIQFNLTKPQSKLAAVSQFSTILLLSKTIFSTSALETSLSFPTSTTGLLFHLLLLHPFPMITLPYHIRNRKMKHKVKKVSRQQIQGKFIQEFDISLLNKRL